MLMPLYYLSNPQNSNSQLIKKVAVAPVKQLAQMGATVVTTVTKPSLVQVRVTDVWPCVPGYSSVFLYYLAVFCQMCKLLTM